MRNNIRLHHFRAVALTLGLIALCLALGKFFHHYFPLLPASLYGLLFFTAILHCKPVNKQTIEHTIGPSLPYMPIVFVPICVGVVEYGDFFRSSGWQFILVIMATTVMTLIIIALMGHIFLQAEHDDRT